MVRLKTSRGTILWTPGRLSATSSTIWRSRTISGFTYVVFRPQCSSIPTKPLRNRKASPRCLSRTCHLSQLLCKIRRGIIDSRLYFIHFLPAQFESMREDDAESRFKKNNAHYSFITSNDVLPKTGLSLSKYRY